MAQSKSTKKLMNMTYGLGASVVIIGALFKILHWEVDLGFMTIGGSLLLAVGLLTEALIFAISAFEPVDDEYDWSLVYPELANGQASGGKNDVQQAQEAEGVLGRKLDEMLKEANIDTELFNSLGDSIRSFEGAAKNISPTTDAIQHTQKYSEELSHAAAQMESLNSLYKVQLDSASRQASINEEVVQNAGALKEQMESLATNLSSLNGVYGGMLSAMSKN
ncbi:MULTISPECIES: gliding motility protein GldL [Croceitalea]|uniref:Gliding motility protein GldL n=1 Tax=Croceitalea vernalis TaxID=3075599 RepID=A0ABU3BBZ6_9FLAO|nr:MULTISPECIES: gliding motility protein GldL [unclassified Croceitalea]MDT0538209.1 gliding motility protein GldL [Croceitalea sp. P059]MDT0619992.1 gliding motility protein GldL [Croceitalea sp. P007]